MTSDFLSEELLDRYLAGGCTGAEQAQVESWLEAHPDARARLSAILHVALPSVSDHRARGLREGFWAQAKKDASTQVSDNHLSLNAEKVRETSSASFGKVGAYSRFSVPRWVGYGAIATILAVLLVPNNILLFERFANRSHTSRPIFREYVTAAGQNASITLPDGSTIRMAPASRVRYPEKFGRSSRDVELDGEAVFTAASHSSVPFVVSARGTTTRVLGTTFGVRAYNTDSGVRIVVSDGKVQVNSRLTLSIGEMSLIKAGAIQVERNVSIGSILGWTQNRLVFDDVAFRTMIEDLSRWYGVRIVLSDPALGDRIVSATFENDPLEQVLSILSKTTHVNIVRSGNLIVIGPK